MQSQMSRSEDCWAGSLCPGSGQMHSQMSSVQGFLGDGANILELWHLLSESLPAMQALYERLADPGQYTTQHTDLLEHKCTRALQP